MTPQPDFLNKLAVLPIRRLRELARVLGIPRYSAQARDGLLQAIATKSPAGETLDGPLSLSAPPSESAHQHSTDGPSSAPQPVTSLQVHPQDAQWAYCSWEISSADRAAAEAAGGGSLCLRLADITGLADGDAHPHAFLETVVEGAGGEWYLPVPLAGRVYRAELGFRTPGGWMSLAFSAPAVMPADLGGGFDIDLVRPFSLDVMPTESSDVVFPAPVGVHERVYQVASQGRRRRGVDVAQSARIASTPGAGTALNWAVIPNCPAAAVASASITRR